MSVQDKIALFSAIGSWVSAFATFLAAFIALYLGFKPYRIKVRAKHCTRYIGDIENEITLDEDKFKIHLIISNHSLSKIYVERVQIVTGGLIQRSKILSRLLMGAMHDQGSGIIKPNNFFRRDLKVLYRTANYLPNITPDKPVAIAPYDSLIIIFKGTEREWVKNERETAKNYRFNYKKIAMRISLSNGKIVYSKGYINMDKE
ncbi:hypothetical protein HX889_29895 [Pseudomonas reactans]|nr:hypothetical protein [Pseudomonas reactans]